ncbi:MAG: single-stranded-DNA-specific exonuclease RecJ [Micavibrio sp.]|nr:single-stranded-DNA-specific exonuclease RecJ [Micavibrio sp.]
MQIDKSLGNNRWVMTPYDAREAMRISQSYGLPEIIGRLLSSREVRFDQVEAFLRPRMRDHFPDPFKLKDMDKMADFVADAVINNRKIGVFADFDVDGATSSAILKRFFRALGQDVPVYIPERLTEGYGPSAEAFAKLKELGVDIIITVDCGATSFGPAQAAKDMGVDLIILDHHETEDTLPVATFLIDPKRQDDTSEFDELAACGVAFLTCVAINACLRDKGFYKDRPEPPLKNWLDLVALGTIADMVPQRGPNRLLVREGLKQMDKRETAGMRALMEVCGVTKFPTPYHIGFGMGPRINAGSRVHQSDLGSKLLSTDDYEEAKNLAWLLNDCNEKRKNLQKDMTAEALEKVKTLGLENDPVIVVEGEGWHSGLSGLVAGKLKETYGRPACVITYAENENGVLEGRGSGRSIEGVNIAASFIEARNEGLLVKGGGHAMAGGFTIMPEMIEPFRIFVRKHVQQQLDGQPILPEMTIDAVATIGGASLDFVKLIQREMTPFGSGNPEPRFALNKVRIGRADIMAERHIRCYVSDMEGGSSIKAVAFGAVGTAMGDALLSANDTPLHLAGGFQINEWQGRESVEFHIADVAAL